MREEEEKQKEKKPLRNWAVLSGIAIQMGATIFVFAWIGQWLDEKYPSNKEWFTILFVLIGVAVAIYAVLRQLKGLNN
ncbi:MULTISPECIES: AtpZ/AtpI family protein [Mesonia]|uniref:Uncharacterized protein n=1 Tax=Mesonia oceanica TaxID=2687242 RepID=A0AC61YBR5_9FLAO|nr:MULTISPECIES: AtpZ/AtpI family protein [Mesonia]MAN27026.1 hypothetical protein [Mesonia sp.]VVV01936.1 hypothetical protein FVB9532_03231 [Mesonia oceanica]|tara:strand:- start:159 stop:392 length:234 start_codon:yes stop_codon:yes gene_type:complete